MAFTLSTMKICKKVVKINMKIHTFKIRLVNGEEFSRCEWGKTRKSALKTLWGIYGRENMVVMA